MAQLNDLIVTGAARFVNKIQGTVDKATCDADGANIASTYMKKGVDYVTAGRKANTTAGTKSTAEGSNATASGSYTHAEGRDNIAKGESSHAEGYSTNAFGNYSHAEGGGTTAGVENDALSYVSCHAEGGQTTASGCYSHAEGYSTTASGNASHTEGSTTNAYGNYSHAEGYNTTVGSSSYPATYQGGHAEGYETTSTGDKGAHAEGWNTTSSGGGAHAEGVGTVASHFASHAEGYYTKTGHNYQHVMGTYNEGNANNIFEIGGGNDDSYRYNLFQVDFEGNVYLNGYIKNRILYTRTLYLGANNTYPVEFKMWSNGMKSAHFELSNVPTATTTAPSKLPSGYWPQQIVRICGFESQYASTSGSVNKARFGYINTDGTVSLYASPYTGMWCTVFYM